MPSTRTANPWRPVVTCSLLALVLVGVVLAQTRPGRSLTGHIGLSAPATSITELYFVRLRLPEGERS
jgi:hypothetical protein